MSTKSSYRPGILSSRRSHELWQIYFDDEGQIEYDLGDGEGSRRSSTKFKATHSDSTAAIHRLHNDDDDDDDNDDYDDDEEVEITRDSRKERRRSSHESNKLAYHKSLTNKSAEISVRTTGKGTHSTYLVTPTCKDSTATGSRNPVSGPGPGNHRIRIRRDSDLEQLLPFGSGRVNTLKEKATKCCHSCSQWPRWKKALLTTVVLISLVVFYVVVVVAIIKGIGGY